MTNEVRTEVSKDTITLITTLSPMFGDPFQVVLSIPKTRPSAEIRNTVPITCHVSKTGNDVPLGGYVYSIYEPKRAQIYQTLLNNAEESLIDTTKRLGLLITKKYMVPSYASISGSVSMEESTLYIREVIQQIERMYNGSETQD